jgi:hypothetical protein
MRNMPLNAAVWLGDRNHLLGAKVLCLAFKVLLKVHHKSDIASFELRSMRPDVDSAVVVFQIDCAAKGTSPGSE